MACSKPLARIEDWNGKVTFEHPTLKDNEAIKVWHQRLENQKNIKSVKMIPCKRCMGCRLDYAKDWANRLVVESMSYDNNYFFTLTYDDEHIPKKINTETYEVSYTLKKEDLQLFWKRLRVEWERKCNHKGIRFFACGEYGDETMRPHYHAIVFNLPFLDDLKYYKTSELGDIYMTSEKLDKIWSKGNVIVGGLSWNSCSYVARYIQKKQYGPEARKYYEDNGLLPEFVEMSNRPGIGRKYYEEHKDEIYEYDEMYIPCKNDIVKIKPLKYFDTLLEQEDPERYASIKARREASMVNQNRNLAINLKSADMVQEQRDIHARELKRKTAILKRDIEY